AVRAGDDLQEVPVRTLPVHPAAAVAGIDLIRPGPPGVGPVPQPTLPDAAEDGIELRLADQERVVLRLDVLGTIIEGQGDVVAEPDIQERAVRRRLVQAQQAGDRPRRADLVPDPDDRVVEQDRHRTPPTQRPAYQPAPPADPVHSDDPKKVST